MTRILACPETLARDAAAKRRHAGAAMRWASAQDDVDDVDDDTVDERGRDVK